MARTRNQQRNETQKDFLSRNRANVPKRENCVANSFPRNQGALVNHSGNANLTSLGRQDDIITYAADQLHIRVTASSKDTADGQWTLSKSKLCTTAQFLHRLTRMLPLSFLVLILWSHTSLVVLSILQRPRPFSAFRFFNLFQRW